MNKKYGKIKRQTLVYAPDVLVVAGKNIIAPFKEDYLNAGYLPIVLGEGLKHKEGYEIIESYRITEEENEGNKAQKYIERIQEYNKLPEIQPTESEIQHKAMIQLAKMQVKEITNDTKALQVKALYDEWSGNGVEYKEKIYLRHKGELYKVNEGQSHISQPDWSPDTAHSLFTLVGQPGEGTQKNPIKWVSGMIAEKDKYYIDEDIVYICIEESEIGLHGKPKDLARYFKSI